MKYDYECAVIGAGPAGLTAALYLKRYRRSVIVIHNGDSRADYAPNIKNLIGYGKGISGSNLLKLLRDQVGRYSTPFIRGEAKVYRSARGFRITTAHHRLHVKKVIMATGMKDTHPKIRNYKALCHKGAIAYCAICDGFDHRDQEIAIFVNSYECLKKVRFIAKYSSKITVVMVKKFDWPNHTLKYFKDIKAQIHCGTIQSLRWNSKIKKLLVNLTGEKPFKVDVAYIELGSTVPLKPLKHIAKLRKDKNGFILVGAKQQTSVPGLFAVGDCVKSLSQISVAVGQAAIASTQIHNDLLNESALT